ncbi:unnamed protein product [Prunus armeniaca]
MHFLSSLLEAAPHRANRTYFLDYGSATPTGCSFGGLPTTIFCWSLVSPWWLSACYGGAACDCRIVRQMSVNGVRVSSCCVELCGLLHFVGFLP